MCGIFGKVVRPGARVTAAELETMGASLRHRGPDAMGVHTDGTAGLGATRLSIIDPAGGRQPVPNAAGDVWAVQNGELYNYIELRARLAEYGNPPVRGGDTAVLPGLYETIGRGFPGALRGMFAIAIWDSRAGRLTLARDRLGIKPLFWAETADGLLFASEIKAILALGFPKAVDRQALHDYLSLDYVPGPRTMFEGIFKLPAGCTLTWDAGAALRGRALSIKRYWDLPPQAGWGAPAGDRFATSQTDLPGRTAASSAAESEPNPMAPPTAQASDDPRRFQPPRDRSALAAHVQEQLTDAVRAAMVSDVPIGAFLSGGLDSSVVVALMSRLTGTPVRTFSVGFGTADASYDELPWARRVARHCGTQHHEAIAEPDAAEIVHALVHAFDEPFGDSSALAAWIVAREAARHTRVVLSGDGGDEVFGGYVIYRADRLAPLYRRLFPGAVGARWLPALARRLPASDRKMSADLMLRRFTAAAARDPLAAHVAWRQIFDEAEKHELYSEAWRAGWHAAANSPNPEVGRRDGTAYRDTMVPEPGRTTRARPPSQTLDLFRTHHAEYLQADPLNRWLALDARVSLVDDMLTKVDRTSMAQSLEVRVPLLDHRLVELMARVPSREKVTLPGLQLKSLLKLAAEDLLPREVIHRRKAGFHVPVPRWLRGELRPLVESALGRRTIARQGIFDPDAVEALVGAHMRGERNASRRIWGLLMFSLWHDAHFG